MDQGHGINPVLTFHDGCESSFVLEEIRLRPKQAHDHLEVVFHPMVHFTKQPFILAKQALELVVLTGDFLLVILQLSVLSLFEPIAIVHKTNEYEKEKNTYDHHVSEYTGLCNP